MEELELRVKSSWKSEDKKCCGVKFELEKLNIAEKYKGFDELNCFYEDTFVPFESLEEKHFKESLVALVNWQENKFDASKAQKHVIALMNKKGEVIFDLR